MAYRYVVLGAGRQGVALAYDLARNGEADRIVLADVDAQVAEDAVARLRGLHPERARAFDATACDVTRGECVARVIAGANVVLSAVPYRFNEALTDLAIAAGASFCDLGGNTQVVQRQLARHAQAQAAGVSVLPDCGLAPGLGNILAAHAVETLPGVQDVHVRCGGLPQERVGPLNYKLVFNFDGLINEYSGFGEFLRDGRRVDVPALTELEDIDLPSPLGRCEAAVTSGGTSTCPETFRGRLRTYDYKTIRYPGHFAIVRALFELGGFDSQTRDIGGASVSPRLVLRKLFEKKLNFPEVPDLVVLRCIAEGASGGQRVRRVYDLLDYQDARTGLTAMERTTAFPAALVAYMQARGLVAAGARPLETALPLARYVEELPLHDIHVQVHEERAV